MTRLTTVSLAGFAATAVTFGPGRMGFGLFLSEFRDSFALTSSLAGLIAGLGFFGFFLGLLTAYLLLEQGGPRRPVVSGLVLAGLGMAIVALSGGVFTLTVGVFLAMASAGLTWAPFNTAAQRALPDPKRPIALSIVSTGTSVGVAAAGVLALWLSLTELSWRVAWALFAASAVLAAWANWSALRGLCLVGDQRARDRWRHLLSRRAVPLYGMALSFGITTAIYISFAADRIEEAGGLPGVPASTSSSVVFAIYGLCGLLGLATGWIKGWLGLPALLRVLAVLSAASHVLVAVAPTDWAAVMASAGLQGVYVMMSSAIFAFWSERLFPTMPGLGFTAALLTLALGSVLGPAVAGTAADRFGSEAIFLGAAAISALMGLTLLTRHIHERGRIVSATT